MNDSEKILTQLSAETRDLDNSGKEEIDQFLSFWKSYIERYRAIVIARQGNVRAAIEHAIKAIQFSPYFPYLSYEEAKQDITKKYALELAPLVEESMSLFPREEPRQENTQQVAEELNRQIEFAELPFNYDFMKTIVGSDEKQETYDFLYKKLSTLDSSNPFLLLTKAELIKYLPKGTAKMNSVYVERFDECISILRSILLIDEQFILVRSKLGNMLFMKGLHYENEELQKEGIAELEKSHHFIAELGFSFATK